MTIATKETFSELTSTGLVLVDFYADWCGPCKMLSPVLEEISKEDPAVSIIKVNVDSDPSLAQQFSVVSIPTLYLLKDGVVIAQTMGYQPKPVLQKFIDQGK